MQPPPPPAQQQRRPHPDPPRLRSSRDDGRQRAVVISNGQLSMHVLPVGAIIQPMARVGNADVPVVNFGSTGVVRCRRCRTYINAFVKFLDGGRRWRCNVCGLSNDVPADYFCELDGDGRRRDRLDRPELHLATWSVAGPTRSSNARSWRRRQALQSLLRPPAAVRGFRGSLADTRPSR